MRFVCQGCSKLIGEKEVIIDLLENGLGHKCLDFYCSKCWKEFEEKA